MKRDHPEARALYVNTCMAYVEDAVRCLDKSLEHAESALKDVRAKVRELTKSS